jgi:S1-C subfamily serine protease
VLAVGRDADGAVVSAAGLAGGHTAGQCGAYDVEEYVLSAPLHEQLAGAGLFTLGGRLVGVVVRCPGRVAALPTSAVARLLADTASAARRVRGEYGLAVAALDARARAYFATDSGVLVTEVDRGGPADDAGLRAGDVLLAVNGAPVARPEDLAGGGAAPNDTLRVTRRRGASVAAVRLARRGPGGGAAADVAGGAGIRVAAAAPPRGVPIATVSPGSAAARAGVRAGDRLLRVGGTLGRTPAPARRLLGALGSAPAFLVFERDVSERDAVERGVLLSPPAAPAAPPPPPPGPPGPPGPR